MKLLALTGGPGCGKTTVSGFFHRDFSWRVIDADALCHELYRNPPPSLLEAFFSRWGKDVLAPSGEIDRKYLAGRVFCAGREDLDYLNAAVHPLILEKIRTEVNSAGERERILLDAPLLFESGWERICDAVLAVWSSPSVQRRRLLERGWTQEHLERRIASQYSAEKKIELADFALINNGSRDWLKRQCAAIHNRFSSPDLPL